MKTPRILPPSLSPEEIELEKALNRPREFRGRKCYPDADVQMIQEAWEMLYRIGKRFTTDDIEPWVTCSSPTISKYLTAEQKQLMRTLPK